MKLIHLSDLHIGKRVNEFSMIEDQEYILNKILEIADTEKPDGVIIAGDVYDKSVPSAEAVQLFDDFLVRLWERGLSVFIISGNHDSPERISFGSKLMNKSGIYLSPVYNGKITPVSLCDSYGKINIWLLPFIKPVHVRRFFEDAQTETYTDALKTVIESFEMDKNERNILVTHQFVTGADRTESEEISVGGSDNVDLGVFEDFDYTALGHIHRSQKCKSDNIRYCGTPLKYSFSEAKDVKSVTVIELKEKGDLSISTIPLVPLRDMIEIRGNYEDIMHRDFYKNTNYENDYVHITLTDEEDIPDAIGKLRTIYHNLMKLDYDNKRTRTLNIIEAVSDTEKKSPFEHFSLFYENQNNQPMTDRQIDFIKMLIGEVWEAEK